MRTLKSVFGVIGALVPVLYFGGLAYYFHDVSGSMPEALTTGLGPTIVGLGVLGLLFSIPLIVQIVRIFVGPRSPGSGVRRGPDSSAHDGESGFDADAVLARYAVRQSAEAAAPGSPATPPAHESAATETRTTFGRRIK